jgi:hypothetical protein
MSAGKSVAIASHRTSQSNGTKNTPPRARCRNLVADSEMRERRSDGTPCSGRNSSRVKPEGGAQAFRPDALHSKPDSISEKPPNV